MGEHLYFHTEAIDAHNDIYPLISESGLAHVLRSTVPLFDEYSKEIVELKEQVIRMTVLFFILIISRFKIY